MTAFTGSQYGFIYASLIAVITLAILNFTVRFVKYRQEFKKMVRLRTSGCMNYY